MEKQNKEVKKGVVNTPLRKKNFTASSTGSERKPVNYEDKIKELEAKLFGN